MHFRISFPSTKVVKDAVKKICSEQAPEHGTKPEKETALKQQGCVELGEEQKALYSIYLKNGLGEFGDTCDWDSSS